MENKLEILEQWLRYEICERRDYSASKMCELTIDKINLIRTSHCKGEVYKQMNNFKERLLEEQVQVNERRNKLADFMKSEKFAEIEPIQMSLLNIQLNAMTTYGQCLTERISWLGNE
jgi:hypothetical protein